MSDRTPERQLVETIRHDLGNVGNVVYTPIQERMYDE